MELSFTESVKENHYTIKCLPKDSDVQRISDVNIEMMPTHVFQRNQDSFGNQTIYGNLYQEHNKFGFRISGIAETGLACGERERGTTTGMYRYSHGLNRPGNGIQAYFDRMVFKDTSSEYEKGIRLMDFLHQDFVYQKGITNVKTTAEEAWNFGAGVCQDYAHIFIALCHLAKIPARYVTGMMVGEGYSHAWVEILSDGIWWGLDPTNGCTVTDSYIKIGAGRDADDCKINKGIMIGGGAQSQKIKVLVE